MFAKPINGGLLLAIGLPAFAIAASVAAAVVAFTRGDPTLPDEYHWEGMQLDRDFAGSRRAYDLDIRATLQLAQLSGTCRVTLLLNADSPPALRLNLVHGTRPDLDREVRLTPAGRDALGQAYEGHCGSVPAGHWHLELADDGRSWSVREDMLGALDGVRIAVRSDSG